MIPYVAGSTPGGRRVLRLCIKYEKDIRCNSYVCAINGSKGEIMHLILGYVYQQRKVDFTPCKDEMYCRKRGHN